MNAGRELDALVAEKVMGWTYKTFPEGVCPHIKHWYSGDQYMLMKPFSSDIGAAWQVVEKLAGPIPYKGHDFTLCGNGRTWTADFASDDAKNYVVEADTAPLAICKAALAACGVEVE